MSEKKPHPESASESEKDTELFEHYNLTVDSGQESLRIDKFLMSRLPLISRNKLQAAAKADCILVNEKAVKANYKVRPNDKIQVMMPHEKREIELIPEDIPLDIIYEDDSLIVLNKQAGIVVHPGYGNYTGTLVNGLVHHFNELPNSGDASRPGLVHRLDKLTTGIMVVAKTEYALSHLAKQFFDRTAKRTYQAIVWGDFEDMDIGEGDTIEGHIGRNPKNRKKQMVFTDGLEGKHAVTHYKVLKRFGYVTLVECKLETGRTHQIRVHFKHIGHPLFGDMEYDGNRIVKGTVYGKYKQFIHNCFKILPRQALHAKTLGFIHPETEKEIFFDSELPDDMVQTLERWEKYMVNRIKL